MKHFIFLFVALLCYSTASQAQYQEGLDPYFGTKGIVTIPEKSIKQPAGYNNGVIQPDGKIIVAASHHVTRFNPDGSLDNSFGVGGTFYQPLMFYYRGIYYPYDFYDISNRVLLQPDGKIICMGYGWLPAPDRYALIIRLMPDGTLDPSFGNLGVVGDSTTAQHDSWASALLMPDGKIVAINNGLRFVSFKSNGSIDSTFGTNGFVISPPSIRPMGDMELQPDGKIIVLLDYFGIGRYHPDGRPDSSFNNIGYNISFSGLGAPFSTAMALRPDGKIWLAGCTLFGSPTKFILARFNADGSIDSTFNAIGYKEYATDTGDENKLRDMLLLPDDKVLLGGRVMNRATKQYNFGLMRIHPGGREDSTFGDNGRLLTAPNGWAEASAELNKLLLQSDGKILGLGTSNTGTGIYSTYSTIVRYYKNGKTSISEKTIDPQLSVYPNPATNIVNIVLPNTTSIEHLSMSNMLGQQLQSWSKAPISNSIDVANLANGVYFLSISIDGITSHQKIIIQH